MVLRTGQALIAALGVLWLGAGLLGCRSGDADSCGQQENASFAYSTQIDDRYAIYLHDSATDRSAPLFADPNADLFDPRWDPDAQRWIFTAQTENRRTLMRGPVAGGEFRPLETPNAPESIASADPNPTDDSLLCEAALGEGLAIWRFDGSASWRPVEGFPQVSQPRWVDDDEFLFLSQTRGKAQPVRMGPDGAQRLASIPEGIIGPYALEENRLWAANGEGDLISTDLDGPDDFRIHSLGLRIFGVAKRRCAAILEATPPDDILPGLYSWSGPQGSSPRRLQTVGANAGQAAFGPN